MMTLARGHRFTLRLLKTVWITSLAAVAGKRSTCSAYHQWIIRSTWKWQICLNQSSANQATFKSLFFLRLKTTVSIEPLYPAWGLNQPTSQPTTFNFSFQLWLQTQRPFTQGAWYLFSSLGLDVLCLYHHKAQVPDGLPATCCAVLTWNQKHISPRIFTLVVSSKLSCSSLLKSLAKLGPY